MLRRLSEILFGCVAVAALGCPSIMPERSAREWMADGRAHSAQARWEDAIADFTEAIRQLVKMAAAANGLFQPEANLANTHVKRALAYVLKGQLEPALADCDEALRLNPSEGTAYRTRAEVYRRKGEHAKAEADLQRAGTLRQP